MRFRLYYLAAQRHWHPSKGILKPQWFFMSIETQPTLILIFIPIFYWYLIRCPFRQNVIWWMAQNKVLQNTQQLQLALLSSQSTRFLHSALLHYRAQRRHWLSKLRCGEHFSGFYHQWEWRFSKTKELLLSVRDLAAIKESEFHASLEYYCDPAKGILTPKENLPIIGLVPPSQLRLKGLDPPYWRQRPIFSPLARTDLTSTTSISASSTDSVDYPTKLKMASLFDDAK